jgi:hypothetical protein
MLLIGRNLTDKTANDNENQLINDLLKEATQVKDPTSPRFLGAKRLKQGIGKTAERLQPLSWDLQGDGATEEEEIMVTKGLKEALHRGGYDTTYTSKGGIIDRILRSGNAYRLILRADPDKTAFPVKFMMVDQNNLFMSTSATSFRGGNKNITELAALFTGTVQEFKEVFPQYADDVDQKHIRPGVIPKNSTTFKDLDQTYTQKNSTDSGGEDQELMDWLYTFDITNKSYRLVAGSDLSILEKEDKSKYTFSFENLEGREEPYIPVSNHICIPAEEGIYDDGLGAYLYDQSIVFRQVVNMTVGHVRENAYPHTLVNIPQDQMASFLNLSRTADQLRNAGKKAYIPVGFNANQGPGAVASAAPILNGGRMDESLGLLNLLDDEFRKCGVYLDAPVERGVTATEVKMNASNALVLPKSIMKRNAPEVEFEVMVSIDIIKKEVKAGDETPLILDTTIELPDGEFSTRSVPFTLGWLAEKLTERQWRVVVDKESGARTDDTAMLIHYQELLPQLVPESPEFAAVQKQIMLLSGVKVPGAAPSTQALVADQATPGGPNPAQGGLPIPQEGAVPPMQPTQLPIGVN